MSGTVERRDTRGIRVALSTTDRRFLGVATFLLTRNGFLVTRGRKGDTLDDLIRQGAVDIVLLDASDSLVAAARRARALQASAPGVGVILVIDGEGENGTASHRNGVAPLQVDRVPKWGDFAAVVSALERSFAASQHGGGWNRDSPAATR